MRCPIAHFLPLYTTMKSNSTMPPGEYVGNLTGFLYMPSYVKTWRRYPKTRSTELNALSSEEDRATSTCTENFVKFIWFLRYASGQTFTQTYRRAYCNTSTPPEGGWSRHKISVAGGRRKKSYSLQTVVL